MLLVDSSVFIAFFSEHDANHGRALALGLSDIATNQFVFAEVANVLEKRVKNKFFVLPVLRQVLEKIPILSLSREELRQALDLTEHHPGLSFTDCSLLLQSKKTGLKLITFDKKLESATLS